MNNLYNEFMQWTISAIFRFSTVHLDATAGDYLRPWPQEQVEILIMQMYPCRHHLGHFVQGAEHSKMQQWLVSTLDTQL